MRLLLLLLIDIWLTLLLNHPSGCFSVVDWLLGDQTPIARSPCNFCPTPVILDLFLSYTTSVLLGEVSKVACLPLPVGLNFLHFTLKS